MTVSARPLAGTRNGAPARSTRKARTRKPRVAPPFSMAWSPALKLQRISRSYTVRQLDPSQGQYLANPDGISTVTLQAGYLFVDGQHVVHPTFGRNFVRFSQSTAQGFLSGVLNFTRDGHAFHGRIYRGPSPALAVANDVSGTTPPVTFTTVVTAQGALPPAGQTFPKWCPPEPGDPGAWQAGLSFTLGYRYTTAGSLPTPIIQLAGNDISPYVASSIDPASNNLVLTMSLDNADAAEAVQDIGANCPASFCIEFAYDGMSFRGVAQLFDAVRGVTLPTQYAWHGVIAPQASGADALSKRTGGPASAVGLRRLATPKSAPATRNRVNYHALAGITDAATEPLAVGDLYSLQADSQTLQNNQFNMLVENMKWALGASASNKDWLTNFYAEVQPQLDSDRTTLITQDMDFYLSRFAPAYLGYSFNGMSGDAAPTTRLSGQQATNLDFYLRAGLAAEPGYTRQSHGIFLQAFTEAIPRLNDYIQDQAANTVNGTIAPGHDWGQQLYDELVSTPLMNQTVNKIVAGQSMDEVNRHSTILLTLQPAGDLASRYHALVVARTLSETFEHMDLSNKDAVSNWLTDAISGFVDALVNDKLDLSGMDPQTAAELKEQADELNAASQQGKAMVELVSNLADIIIASQGTTLWARMAEAQAGWAKAGYRFAQSFYVLAFIGNLTYSIMAFRNWKNLSATDKASLVTSVVAMAAQILKNVPSMIDASQTGIQWTFAQIGKFKTSLADPQVTDATYNAMEDIEPNSIQDGANSMNSLVNSETNTLETAGTSWAETWDSSVGTVCKAISIAASVAFAVIATIQFIQDIEDHKPTETEALDGIIMSANIVVAFCAVLELASVGEVVPVVGAVFAIIGAVASLIEMFDPPAKPKSPVELFMENVLVPAAEGSNRWLLDAPAGWQVGQLVPEYNVYHPQPSNG